MDQNSADLHPGPQSGHAGGLVEALLEKAEELRKRPPLPHLAALALPLYQQAAALAPERTEIRFRLAKAHWAFGQSDMARHVCAQTLAQSPEAVEARLHHAIFHLPVFYRHLDEPQTGRRAYEAELVALAQDVAGDPVASQRLADWADRVYPYFLPYQGLNDVAVQRVYGTMLCQAMATAYPAYARAAPVPPVPPGKKLRIGIVSRHFNRHSNWRAITSAWMEGLDPSRFAIHAYSLGKHEDDCTARARQLAARFVHGERGFEDWCREIASDHLHLLIYPAIGDFTLQTKLAMLRLAPIQCLAAGHCTTSGFPSLDYFLSAELTEPPDAQEHYSETLVKLPGLGLCYTPPAASVPARDRAYFGLRSSATVFLSPNHLSKYLPEHDVLYAQIARRIEDCQIVFVRLGNMEPINAQFEQRLKAVFREQGVDWDRHVRFLPRLSRSDYNDLQSHGDVYLDSIGWNGGVTSSLALGYDLPMVTLTGPVFRGRMGTAMLRLMGIEDTIATTPDDYVDIAVRLGQDAQWRQDLRRRIAAAKSRIYENPAVAAGLASFIEDAVARAAVKDQEQRD